MFNSSGNTAHSNSDLFPNRSVIGHGRGITDLLGNRSLLLWAVSPEILSCQADLFFKH